MFGVVKMEFREVQGSGGGDKYKYSEKVYYETREEVCLGSLFSGHPVMNFDSESHDGS